MTNDPRSIDAEWNERFVEMLKSGVDAEQAADAMLRVAALTIECLRGPRLTSAGLISAAMFFVERAGEVHKAPSLN
jgi:hypothetical protein